ncbi:hypothetical protein OH77DRAFT_1439297 [Trametes cingulata]|nr:hypothetical protein OH77DRAFT_1439297 [Trametes cingulata]
MLTYEYIITLDQEVALFWRRKITGATALFLATRYLALLSYSFFGAATFITTMSDASCLGVVEAQQIATVTQYAVWAAFSVLRVLALSGMNWVLALAVSVLAFAPFIVNSWVTAQGLVGQMVPILGCAGGSKQTAQEALIGAAVSRSCAMAADLVVIFVTWLHTAKGTPFRDLLRGTRGSLAQALLVNASISRVHLLLTERPDTFRLIVILNALQLAFTFLSKIIDVLDETSAIIVFTDPVLIPSRLTAILICRLLMALQSANQRALGQNVGAETQAEDDGGNGGTLRFATMVIGSIAESVLDDGSDSESLLDVDGSAADTEEGCTEEAISEEVRYPKDV